jgi:hypothetical protein
VLRTALLAPMALSAMACYGTSTIPAAGALPLRQGPWDRDLLLRDQDADRVRLAPGSWVRLRRADGQATRWFEARSLRTDGDRIWGRSRPGARTGIVVDGVAWGDLRAVEINQFDLAETVVGTAAGTTVVFAAAGLELTLILILGLLSGGHLQTTDLGITRGAVEMVVAQAFRRPAQAERPASLALPPATAETHGRPLFTGAAIRRDRVRLSTSTEMGAAALDRAGAVVGLAASLRLLNTWELGGGLRLIGRERAEATSLSGSVAAAPFARVGLHLDVDAARRFAAALGVDAGRDHAKLNLGLRFRATRDLQIGLHLLNPMSARHDGRWRRFLVTTVEIGLLL